MAPLVIKKALKQFLYDKNGEEFLDCISDFALVGHNHPQVVAARHNQSKILNTAHGFHNQLWSDAVKALLKTLPDTLSVCYIMNSESEANDLALKIAKLHTKGKHIVAFEGATHGTIGDLKQLIPDFNLEHKNKVHTIPMPNLYSGPYREDDPDAVNKYLSEAAEVIHSCNKKGNHIAALIAEPIFVSAGVIPPPKEYITQLYKIIEDSNALWIADETKTGLGRAGENFWAFSSYDIVPDILTVGRQLGNGHPIGAVFTTKELSDNLGEYFSTFGGNPVSCAVVLSVLAVMQKELLIEASKAVGRTLIAELRAMGEQFEFIGQVRGQGLCIGVELVHSKWTRESFSEGAKYVAEMLKINHNILVDCIGPSRNILFLAPPLCFTQLNARTLIKALGQEFQQLCKYLGTNNMDELMDASTSPVSSRGDRSPCMKKLRKVYQDVD